MSFSCWLALLWGGMFHVGSSTSHSAKAWGPQRGLFVACLVVGIGSLLALDLHFAPSAIAAKETRDPPSPVSGAQSAAATSDTRPALATRVVIPAPARVPTIVARFDSASKEPSDESGIRALATAMIEDHDVTIILEGHSDMRGGDDYNHAISLERASWVKARLVALGVSGDRIETVGLGATRPLRSDDRDGPSVNRRVEVRWLGGSAGVTPSSPAPARSVRPKETPPPPPRGAPGAGEALRPRGRPSAGPAPSTPDASVELERPRSTSSDAAVEPSPVESPRPGDN